MNEVFLICKTFLSLERVGGATGRNTNAPVQWVAQQGSKPGRKKTFLCYIIS